MALRLDDRKNTDSRFAKRSSDLRKHARSVLDAEAKVILRDGVVDGAGISHKGRET